ncbi:ethanolamine ammonia-lyase small subunit [Janthinobacterium sp. CG_23.3]|uniref:ethanolamine ammonia-lyase subunit EutC n=1 Tax=unclassified Janthinobacterium TaxID=2610881 RepID=UPI000349FBDA|nr:MULTISPECIES: ethanolamine ammonia-lyase subunit EutC [unclassified Janthinobacterium]MEC5161265.1 ethanolamine ammonia-lyase small subunit [Janthinobacterium sp. CG_S6]
MSNKTVIANPWQALRQFTAARIALGRTGVSQPTEPQLAFQLAHARARDAVHLALDAGALARSLGGALQAPLPCIELRSAAESRHVYLQRPDLGRKLDAASRRALIELGGPAGDAAAAKPYDLAFVVADGLSALAIEQNALPFLQILTRRLAPEQWSLAPVSIVQQGRVAIGDEVGELLGARAVLVLIGERPGLSSPDSMGLYLTWAPRAGLTDESRNCISNVRPAGLRYEEAAFKLHYLLSESRRRQLSGVDLKDETPGAGQPDVSERKFLL